MYGDTPPSVVAVPGPLVSSPGRLTQLAYAVDQQLRHRPAWFLVFTPTLSMQALRDLHPEPTWRGCTREEAAARALQAHLARGGLVLPLSRDAGIDVARRRTALVPTSGDVVPETLDWAARLGSRTVRFWWPAGQGLPAWHSHARRACLHAGVDARLEDPLRPKLHHVLATPAEAVK